MRVNKRKKKTFILVFYLGSPRTTLRGKHKKGDIMKVYVVTRGEYDNYEIITATTDKDLANK